MKNFEVEIKEEKLLVGNNYFSVFVHNRSARVYFRDLFIDTYSTLDGAKKVAGELSSMFADCEIVTTLL